jgi:4'-phosphopantetheinyl transferase
MSTEVDLWLLFPDEVRDAALLRRYRELLTEEERAHEKRFRFGRDQHRFLLTRVLVRTVLSRYASIAPREWRFAPDAHGRPCITNPDPALTELSFNLSHTEGLILLGVTRRRALGVDAEHIWSRTASASIAERYFAPAEAQALRELPEALRNERFFEYWTLKESYIKARGQGLALGLGNFSFSLHAAGSVRVSFRPELEDAPEHWHFWQFNPSPDHVAAVCVRRMQSGTNRLLARKIVPFANEQPLEIVMSRQSRELQ